MTGQWFYDAERTVWELVVLDRVEVTISDAMLQALRWIATRPQTPYLEKSVA